MSEEALKTFVRENNFVEFVKTSAKEDSNITDIFDKLVKEIYKKEELISKTDDQDENKQLNFASDREEKIKDKCKC